MTHFGILCPSATGHINPLACLGRELCRRGHQVTFFQVPDAEARVLASGLDCHIIGASDFPLGTMSHLVTTLGELQGLDAVRYSLQWIQREAVMMLNDVPAAIQARGIEALIIDQISMSGGAIAEYLDLPFVSFCSALPVDRDDQFPPFTMNWNYSPAPWSRLRNRLAYGALRQLGKPILTAINQRRQDWGLRPYASREDIFSTLAQISQQPREFEFPRRHPIPHFHFTGPHHDSATRKPIDFPFERLTGQPLIYASMGTLQNQQQWVFEAIAQACQDLPVQLVISLGNTQAALPSLPGSPIVVAYAPQLELLQRATLTLTHAGLNTVLESLTQGVPMVAIPVTNDQPGVAARLVWSGAGEKLPLAKLQVPKLRAAIQTVLTQPSYRQNAQRLQRAIQQCGGVVRSADIVEQAILTRQPVLA